MPISERLAQLGSGVFARNDRRKGTYLSRATSPGSSLPPLLDLSLGSTDLLPKTVVCTTQCGFHQSRPSDIGFVPLWGWLLSAKPTDILVV
jgi:hypothetical protein